MPEPFYYPEWRAEQRRTKYPFADTATLTNGAGAFVADDAILDISLYPIGGRERMFLSRVLVEAAEITLYFGDAGDKLRCSGTFSLTDPPTVVALTDGFGRPAGLLVSESALLAQFQALGLGTHDFSVTATELCAVCVLPTPEPGVRGFLLDDGTIVAGDAWLVGGDGVVLTRTLAATEDDCGNRVVSQVLLVDIVGDPLFRQRLCDPTTVFAAPRLLKQLRILKDCDHVATLTPDDHGNISLRVGSNLASDTTLRIRPTEQGLRLETAEEGADA